MNTSENDTSFGHQPVGDQGEFGDAQPADSSPGRRGASGADGGPQTDAQRYAQGLTIRREVLGDEYVDRAVRATDEVSADFQDFISRYAWGDVWARPGLDRRSRSIAVLTALVAHGHYDELAMHVRAALRNGLTRTEIIEVLLQAGVYLGVPAANSAFKVAETILAETDTSSSDDPNGEYPSGASVSFDDGER